MVAASLYLHMPLVMCLCSILIEGKHQHRHIQMMNMVDLPDTFHFSETIQFLSRAPLETRSATLPKPL